MKCRGRINFLQHGLYISMLLHFSDFVHQSVVSSLQRNYVFSQKKFIVYNIHTILFDAHVDPVPALCLLSFGGAPLISHQVMAQKPYILHFNLPKSQKGGV